MNPVLITRGRLPAPGKSISSPVETPWGKPGPLPVSQLPAGVAGWLPTTAGGLGPRLAGPTCPHKTDGHTHACTHTHKETDHGAHRAACEVPPALLEVEGGRPGQSEARFSFPQLPLWSAGQPPTQPMHHESPGPAEGNQPRLATCCKGQWSSHSRPGRRIDMTSSVVRSQKNNLNLNSNLSTTFSHGGRSPHGRGNQSPGGSVARRTS